MDYSNLSENRKASIRAVINALLNDDPRRLDTKQQSFVDFCKVEQCISVTTGKRLLGEVLDERQASGRSQQAPSAHSSSSLHNNTNKNLMNHGSTRQNAIKISSTTSECDEDNGHGGMRSLRRAKQLATPTPSITSRRSTPPRQHMRYPTSCDITTPASMTKNKLVSTKMTRDLNMTHSPTLSLEEIRAYNGVLALACRNLSDEKRQKLDVSSLFFEKRSIGDAALIITTAVRHEMEENADNGNTSEVEANSDEHQQYDNSSTSINKLRSELDMLATKLSEAETLTIEVQTQYRVLQEQHMELGRELVSKTNTAYEQGLKQGRNTILEAAQLQWFQQWKETEVNQAVDAALKEASELHEANSSIKQSKQHIKAMRAQHHKQGRVSKAHIKRCTTKNCQHTAHRSGRQTTLSLQKEAQLLKKANGSLDGTYWSTPDGPRRR